MKKTIGKENKVDDNKTVTSTAPVVQAKLTVGSTTSEHEKQADAVADKVTQMPQQNFVQRKCADCEKEEEKQVQRKETASAGTGGGVAMNASLSSRIENSKGNGSSLDGATQSFMESRFGSNFNDVKIHTDGEAIQMSQELNARAFTTGNDIYFNRGEYQPSSGDGQHLLAHELTHTIQQGASGGKMVQRSVKEKNKRCIVHAFDNSKPEDNAVVVKDEKPWMFGVGSVDEMVTKTNDYINDKSNYCQCVGQLEINGHGTDGYQSVGNGDLNIDNEKGLRYDSDQAKLDKLKNIKFCDRGTFLLQGCHVGRGNGKTLMKRISNVLPGILIGGAENYTFGTGLGNKKVVTDDKNVNAKYKVVGDKGESFFQSKNMRWYFTTKEGTEYTSGHDSDPGDLEMKVKKADKVKVITPEGETIKIK